MSDKFYEIKLYFKFCEIEFQWILFWGQIVHKFLIARFKYHFLGCILSSYKSILSKKFFSPPYHIYLTVSIHHNPQLFVDLSGNEKLYRIRRTFNFSDYYLSIISVRKKKTRKKKKTKKAEYKNIKLILLLKCICFCCHYVNENGKYLYKATARTNGILNGSLDHALMVWENKNEERTLLAMEQWEHKSLILLFVFTSSWNWF
jgi:hypothetical protein